MMRADELTVVVAQLHRDVTITYTNVTYELTRNGVTVTTGNGNTEHHQGLHVVDLQTFNAAPAA